jgi:hypothetical protein
MTIASKSNALSTAPDGNSGTVNRIQQLGQWITPVFRRLGERWMAARLRLKRKREVEGLSDRMLRDIGMTKVNVPGGTPGRPTTCRIVGWRSLEFEPWSD